MTFFRTKWLGPALGLLAAATALAPAHAVGQATPPGFASFPEDPGAALSRHLVSIAENPGNLSALKGAGEAALALGDPQAALGFLARAEGLSPRDGSIKAAMGSALLALEQARAALRFFDEARGLGVPEAVIAGDRGLAYDLIGNPRLAQRDYQMALKRQDDPEIRRRLALSLAISGERDAALRTIDAQLRQQDRAAWRVRAFVLALTGDTRGATDAVRAVMAPPVAAAMEPFLARLPSLAPADRAFAVHFGRFPESGIAAATASAAASQPGALADAVRAGTPDPRQAPLGTASAGPSGAQSEAQQPQPPPPPQVTQLADGSLRAAVPPQISASEQPAETLPPASASERRIAAAAPLSSSPSSAAPLSLPSTSIQRSPVPPSSSGPIQTAGPDPSQPAEAPVTPTSLPSTSESGSGDFADVVMLVSGLTEPPPGSVPVARPPAAKPAPARGAAAKPQDSKPQPKKAPAPPREPSRIWVQVAGGADKEALPREFARLKAKAPAIFDGKTAWTTALRATNRLLVGPFRTEREAQDFVNQLGRAELAGFSWTSEEGQAVERLPAR